MAFVVTEAHRRRKEGCGMGMITKPEMHEKICNELTSLYRRKNADYGDSFGKSYKEYGMAMPCIRLEDKLNRLKSLTRKEAQVADESVEDTLSDLANYAIMTIIEMRMKSGAKENENT